MTVAESVSVPVQRLPDGREFIARAVAEDRNEVKAFVERCQNYWVYDPCLSGWVGPVADD